MTLPELAIRRPVTAVTLLVSLAVLGCVAIPRIPLAFLPDMEEPELFVRLPYPNASPEQVERMVVRPVEDAVGSVQGLRRIWSRCDEDGGMIRLEFEWGHDLHVARMEVWEKIDRVRGELPDDIGDITVGTSWNDRETDDPVLEGRLSSELDLSESWELLDRKIARPLRRLNGVAQVRLDGVAPREVRIDLRLADLDRHRVDVRDVARAIRTSNLDRSLGHITEGDRRWALRVVGGFAAVEEIRDLPIREDGLRLRDVADVVYEEPELDYGRHLDGNFAIGVTVSTESSANVVEVCEALRQRIDRLEEDPELEGVEFLVWFDQGREIRKTLRELLWTGITGAVLASAVLYLFLRRLSTTVASVVCIPFSLVVTCGVIWLRGGTLNTLSLLGLIVGIGMLVDNAVVVMENIFRHQEGGEDRSTAARKGAREVSTAVIAATSTSVIVFLPIIYNRPSEMNIPLREIGITVCLTLLASLFVSQTLIPLVTSWCIRVRRHRRERWLERLEGLYERVLAFNLRHRWCAPVVGLAIAASAVVPFSETDMNFDSRRTELYAQIRYEFSEEVALETKEETVTRVEELLEPHHDELLAKSVYSWWSEGFTMTRVYLRDGEASQENIARVRDRLREILPPIAGVELEVSAGRRSWRHDRGKRIAFQIVGEDSEVLHELAEEARRRLEAIPGLEDTFTSAREGRRELWVVPERDLLARYDLRGTSVAEAVGLTFRGRRLRRFRSPEGEREMRLTLDEERTESVPQLRELPLWSEDGTRVRLAAVADLVEAEGRHRIERDGRRTSVWVGANYTEGTREGYMPRVRRLLSSMEFPYGYSWTFGAWHERRERQSREFLVDLVLALLLVFAVMAGLFESVLQAVALMIALPFALAGAAWALWLTGTDLDQPAAVGVLLLIGIVVNNGIVMLEHINGYRRRGMPRREAMLRGGRERLRPILMTAMTTLLGLVPIAVQQPSLGGMYYYSMAWVLIGGLVLSTFLTSVFLPAVTTLVEDGAAAVVRGARGAARRVPGRRTAAEAQDAEHSRTGGG